VEGGYIKSVSSMSTCARMLRDDIHAAALTTGRICAAELVTVWVMVVRECGPIFRREGERALLWSCERIHSRKKKKYQILHFKNFCGLNFEAREGCPLEFAVGQTPRWIILPLPNSYSLTDDDR